MGTAGRGLTVKTYSLLKEKKISLYNASIKVYTIYEQQTGTISKTLSGVSSLWNFAPSQKKTRRYGLHRIDKQSLPFCVGVFKILFFCLN